MLKIDFIYFLFGIFVVICLFESTHQGGFLTWRKQKSDSLKLVCYMTNWAQYRPNNTKFTPNDIDPFLCTHVIYAFAAINTTNFEIKSVEWNDETAEKKGLYEQLNDLKDVNPSLKTLLAVGGWNMGSKPFSDMSRSEKHRSVFVNSTIKFLRKWKFDGLDLDWEFPAKRDGRDEDKQSFTYLVRDLREAFYNEAIESRQEQLLLSAAVAQEKYTILKGYDIPNIISYLDFISIMCYDYHGSWDKKTGFNAPLFESDSDNKRLSVDWTVRLYLTLGVPLDKLILGIPYYGRSFTLKSKMEKSFGSAAIGDGLAGEATRESGFLSYGFEICKYLKKDNWTRKWSKEHQVPFAYKSNQWVGYDDESSIRIKVSYIVRHCLGGAMIWAIDLDDFKSFCSNKTFPLTRMVGATLKELNRNKCARLQKVEDIDLNEYTSKVTKWTFSSNEKINPLDDKFNYLPDSLKQTKSSLAKASTKRAALTNVSTTTRKFLPTIRFRPQLNHQANQPVKQKLQQQQIQNNKIIRPTLQSSNYIKLINTTKSNIYLLSRSDKINTIFLAFQNSKLKDDVRIDEIFKHFLSNNSQTSSNLKYNAKSLNLNKIAPTKVIFSKEQNDNENIEDKICKNLSDGEFVRDPTNCAAFWTCFLGKAAQRTTCDNGLVFDLNIKVCNWKADVSCN